MVKLVFGEADPESPELELELPSIGISFLPECHGLRDGSISIEAVKSPTSGNFANQKVITGNLAELSHSSSSVNEPVLA